VVAITWMPAPAWKRGRGGTVGAEALHEDALLGGDALLGDEPEPSTVLTATGILTNGGELPFDISDLVPSVVMDPRWCSHEPDIAGDSPVGPGNWSPEEWLAPIADDDWVLVPASGGPEASADPAESVIAEGAEVQARRVRGPWRVALIPELVPPTMPDETGRPFAATAALDEFERHAWSQVPVGPVDPS
jgi:hypothetical protein